jgi:hypothetical protein
METLFQSFLNISYNKIIFMNLKFITSAIFIEYH